MWRSDPAAVTSARYCRRIFAVSVLPAPDSPEMTTDCRVQQVPVSAGYRRNALSRLWSQSVLGAMRGQRCAVPWHGTWLCEFCIMPRCAEEATAYTWGGNSA